MGRPLPDDLIGGTLMECVTCGEVVHREDGYVLVAPCEYRHANCRDAAYARGRRDGYDDAVRQIKLATHALKRTRLSVAREDAE